jgi:hypothetical protein
MKKVTHDIIYFSIRKDLNHLSFPQARRAGNPSFSDRFRTSRNDNSLRTYVVMYDYGRRHAA